MNNKNRTYNSMVNFVIGFICQLLIMIASFVSRTFFIKILGSEYLGINGLYTNILSILSLAELGIGNVLLFSLYKPIAENDEDKICGLIWFYKKIYIFISLSILIIGLLLVPFLKYIITDTTLCIKDLIFYYILFLFDSVSTYLFVYKSTLINADQKNYIVKKYTTYCVLLCKVIQIIILYISKNYYCFLICQIFFTILTNVILSIKADKMYPFLKNKSKISKNEKRVIFNNIKATIFYKLSNKLLNSTDNIIISLIIGTIMVGYYSNYYLIITALNSAILILSNALMSSIGNLNAKESEKKKKEIFFILVYIFHWIIAFCTISFIVLSKDFISIWIGKEFILNDYVLGAIALNFFIAGIEIPIWLYREALGLFDKVKGMIFLSAILNIIFSVLLGFFFGLAGILYSTSLAKIITTSWYEPKLLFNVKFLSSSKKYFYKQLKLIFVSFVSLVLCILLGNIISFTNIYFDIFYKAIICLLIINVTFIILTNKSNEFNYIKSMFLNKMIKKKA